MAEVNSPVSYSNPSPDPLPILSELGSECVLQHSVFPNDEQSVDHESEEKYGDEWSGRAEQERDSPGLSMRAMLTLSVMLFIRPTTRVKDSP